jgi:RNA polymerase sigma-70 factor (ECF subfamily)
MLVATRDMTLSGVERLEPAAGEVADALRMDEDAFRAFYERTARPLWAYLSRVTGEGHLADDLLQEAFYRFLRADVAFESEAHRRNYLYRIATNLARDSRRRKRTRDALGPDPGGRCSDHAVHDGTDRADDRSDLRRAMAGLSRREREVLWLAYAEGLSHQAIADALGLKASGIKVLLFRARRKLARLLRVAPPRLSGGSGRAQD